MRESLTKILSRNGLFSLTLRCCKKCILGISYIYLWDMMPCGHIQKSETR